MKTFVYLYPIKAYINQEIKQNSWYKNKSEKEEYITRVKDLNQIIDVKYRRKGYRIVYLNYKNEEGELDNSLLSEYLIFQPSDVFLDVGITCDDMRNECYPNEKLLIKKLLPIDELIVAGFHRHDCVARFNNAALSMGINSEIESTLTEDYFFFISRGNDFKTQIKEFEDYANTVLERIMQD